MERLNEASLSVLGSCQGESGPGVNLTSLTNSGSRVLPEKLTGSQLVKKFPALYGTQRFITAFASALHLSLS